VDPPKEGLHMGVIAIDYSTLTLVVILLFAAIGFTRGWLREGITTVVLVFLVLLLYNPEVVSPIVNMLNKVLKLVSVVIQDAFQFDLAAMAQAAKQTPDLFSPGNPYNFLMWALIVLVGLSFLGSRILIGGTSLSAFSRILGGILGAVNGFIAISLFREFIQKYWQNLPSTQVAQAQAQGLAAPANGVAVALQNVPAESFIVSVGPILALLAGGIILLLILSRLFKWKVS
jgi:hypothetical protein